jgi:hypothetical protein
MNELHQHTCHHLVSRKNGKINTCSIDGLGTIHLSLDNSQDLMLKDVRYVLGITWYQAKNVKVIFVALIVLAPYIFL